MAIKQEPLYEAAERSARSLKSTPSPSQPLHSYYGNVHGCDLTSHPDAATDA